MLKIITYPNPILRQTAKKVSQFNDELKKIVNEMAKVMLTKDGIGLAAVQVNISKQIVVLKDSKDYKVLINPKITYFSKDKKTKEEGCLSFPGIFGLVTRPKKIHLKYQDLDGKVIKEKNKGLEAVVIQHEIDHLNGVLFIDKAVKITQGQAELEKLTVKLK